MGEHMGSFQEVLPYVAVPVVATIIGGAIAAYRSPGPQWSSRIQHFTAGVVFAAVAAELLPEITAAHATLDVVVGFALGVIVMLAVRRLAQGSESEGVSPGASEAGNPSSLLVTVAVDLVVDGLLVGIGFAAGGETGVLITIALTLEVLFLGLSVAASLATAGTPRARVIATMTGLSLVLGVSATAGVLLLGGISGGLEAGILAFGAAALLYLVTEELLIEAHEVKETPMATALFFAGFLLLFILDGLV